MGAVDPVIKKRKMAKKDTVYLRFLGHVRLNILPMI
jgi:hypothetical protein